MDAPVETHRLDGKTSRQAAVVEVALAGIARRSPISVIAAPSAQTARGATTAAGRFIGGVALREEPKSRLLIDSVIHIAASELGLPHEAMA